MSSSGRGEAQYKCPTSLRGLQHFSPQMGSILGVFKSQERRFGILNLKKTASFKSQFLNSFSHPQEVFADDVFLTLLQ